MQTNTYDADGRLLRQQDAVQSGAAFTYDLAGNRTKIATTGGATQELEYDAQGNIVGVVDGNKNRTTYRLDDWGRIIGIVKADGSTELYTYDCAGNMTTSTDGEGNTTKYEYGHAGLLTAIEDPTGERETYGYDADGRMIRKTDRNGVTVEYAYNLYGAPLFRKAKNGTLADYYEYTPEGLLKCAISAGMRYSYEYDALDRMVRKSASGQTLLALAYDGNGNKISQRDVSGKETKYIYSPLDLLSEVWDDGQRIATYEYNADGTVRDEIHGSIRRWFRYDADKNLTSCIVLSYGETLTDNRYIYDGNGNMTRKFQRGGDTRYHYDLLNQLKKVEYPSYREELFYDKAGNRTHRIISEKARSRKHRITNVTEEQYRYDSRNRLISYTKGGVTTPFRYDNAGNLLSDDRARYSYDAFNRTVKVETFDGNVQVNRYDAEDLRHEMEENGTLVQFIFNLDREVVTEQSDGSLNRFIRGTELIARNSEADSARTYYHYASDELGSITHIVDESGVVCNRYAYDAWGRIVSQEETVPNRFKFTGQQLDPVTQQYYLRARFYNPVVARFTQEDTYRGDGLNLYAYCANNPVFYVDPTGHSACACKKGLHLNEDKLTKGQNNIYQRAKGAPRNATDSKSYPEVNVPKGGFKNRNEWREAYRNARMERKPVSDRLRQIHDIEQFAGMRLPNAQMAMIMKYNVSHQKLTIPALIKRHRKQWRKKKNALIKEWADNLKLKWPKYSHDAPAQNGKKPAYRKGWKYDAHEIIPNAYNAPLEWWNIVPIHRDNHQGGIHRKGGVHYQAFPDLY